MRGESLLKTGAIMLILSAPFTLGACATQKSVEAAQARADSAYSLAQQAMQKADQAAADAAAANEKADRMFHKSMRK